MKRLVLLACLLGMWATAQADGVTFGFTGTLMQEPLLDPLDPFAGSIASGTPFSGTYVFEASTPDGDPSANGGSYGSVPGSLALDIGGYGFTAADLLNIGVGDDFSGSDFYTVLAAGTAGPDTFTVSLMLQDLDGTALAGAALPIAAPDLAAFELADFFFDGLVAGNQVQFQGALTSLTCVEGCAAVPEPGTLALLAAGLALLRRRRS